MTHPSDALKVRWQQEADWVLLWVVEKVDELGLRIRQCDTEGWVTRHYKPTVPPQVTYSLAPKVMELDGVLSELDRIAERWYGKGRKKT